ncbi:MAG: hypothetical protein WBK55_08735 [Alphaproteobacteria bacterium]
MTRFLPLVAFVFFTCFAGPVFAAQNAQETTAPARFFSSMQDVPLVAGLAELNDQTVTFDKPEGRIIESVAEIESGSFDSVKKAYDQALPQLGWNRITENSYARDNEFLHLNFETYGGRNFVRVLVRPREGIAQ